MNEQEQMEFFYDIFDANLPRLGPGDDASTRKALDTIIEARSEGRGFLSTWKPRILDLGCGNGAQTMELAANTEGTILALDNHEPYLEELERRAVALGVEKKIHVCLGDMQNLELEKGPFDVVSGGSLAVTELCWLRPDVPEECRAFFESEYPSMVDAETNLDSIKDCGYYVLDHFVLPESAWWESYYTPLEGRLQVFRESYAGCPEKLEYVEFVQSEIDMYQRYSSYYGYVFFIMQR
jgi:SAM-dependent methyltransferase